MEYRTSLAPETLKQFAVFLLFASPFCSMNLHHLVGAKPIWQNTSRIIIVSIQDSKSPVISNSGNGGSSRSRSSGTYLNSCVCARITMATSNIKSMPRWIRAAIWRANRVNKIFSLPTVFRINVGSCDDDDDDVGEDRGEGDCDFSHTCIRFHVQKWMGKTTATPTTTTTTTTENIVHNRTDCAIIIVISRSQCSHAVVSFILRFHFILFIHSSFPFSLGRIFMLSCAFNSFGRTSAYGCV